MILRKNKKFDELVEAGIKEHNDLMKKWKEVKTTPDEFLKEYMIFCHLQNLKLLSHIFAANRSK
jgi:hypothetical protein